MASHVPSRRRTLWLISSFTLLGKRKIVRNSALSSLFQFKNGRIAHAVICVLRRVRASDSLPLSIANCRFRAFAKRAEAGPLALKRKTAGVTFAATISPTCCVCIAAPITAASQLEYYKSDGTSLSAESTTVAELAGDLAVVHVTVRQAAAQKKPIRVGIVCQLKDASVRLDSFVRYHLLIGFDRLYLYFDDCREVEDIELARNLSVEFGSRVIVTVRDRELAKIWSGLDGWERLRPFANQDVQVRQMLNALHALGCARCDGIDWLLHIDSDELFYPGPAATSIASHFEALNASPCSIFTYYNYEAVPEEMTVDTTVDPFPNVTLFKRPLSLVDEDSSQATASVAQFWRRRAPNNELFLFYQNGKSAVRCTLDAVPTSVHLWSPRNLIPRPGLHCSNDPRNKGVTCDASVDCGILHYACTDPTMLWRKYATLGAFPDSCVANTVAHEPDTFHCHCRNEYLKHRSEPDGGRAAMRALFQNHIMLNDERESADHIAAGLLQRIELPATTLHRRIRK